MKLKLKMIVAASWFLSVALAGSALAQYSPQVGERHPDFCLKKIDGDTTVKLSDFRGKKVLLIHFASW